jgi:hypothetical protein
VAVVSGGYIYTSTDSGVNWTQRGISAIWIGVASSSDGVKLVAGAYGGYIYTSTDSGVNWTARDSPRNWAFCTSSSDGTKLAAVVNPGFIYTSTDSGVNWTQRESSRNWNSIASSSDGTKLVAVVGSPSGYIYTSTDSGISWTARDSSRNWYAVASSADGTKLVAGDYGGYIYTMNNFLYIKTNAGISTGTAYIGEASIGEASIVSLNVSTAYINSPPTIKDGMSINSLTSNGNPASHAMLTYNSNGDRLAYIGYLINQNSGGFGGTTGDSYNYRTYAYTPGGGISAIYNICLSTNMAGFGTFGTVYFYENVVVGGNLNVRGALSKASGSFKIDHPLPEKIKTHYLVHSFIEGPKADLMYRGKVALVDGRAVINIDQAAGMTEGTFVTLCREIQCFTTNESDWIHVRGNVEGNIITIEAKDSTATSMISWMVIGERKDKHMYDTDWTDENGHVIVEPLKIQMQSNV